MVVSNSKASGLSARTGDLVHKQLNPQVHEYKLSKLSGIQVHPLTKTLTWFSFNPAQFPISCKDATFDWFKGTPFGFSLKRAQPTCESHFLKAPTRSVKGSAACGVMGRLMGGKEEETEGNWRKPEKKRRKKVKVSMIVMVKVLMGLGGTGMVVLSLFRRERRHGNDWVAVNDHVSVVSSSSSSLVSRFYESVW